MDDRNSEGDGPPLQKPRPVRPAPAPAREVASGSSAREEGEEGGAAGKPTPVRRGVGDEKAPGPPVPESPPRTFRAEGETWIVRIAGRTRTGTRPDSGIPLKHLRFYRESDPEEPVREIYQPGGSLDHLYDEELEGLLARARPVPTEEDLRQEERSRRRDRRKRRGR